MHRSETLIPNSSTPRPGRLHHPCVHVVPLMLCVPSSSAHQHAGHRLSNMHDAIISHILPLAASIKALLQTVKDPIQHP
jgi:hypothetical protein